MICCIIETNEIKNKPFEKRELDLFAREVVPHADPIWAMTNEIRPTHVPDSYAN